MKIFLLTHERELNRPSNTGQLALTSCREIVERILWKRTQPNEQLLKLIAQKNIALMYPSKTTQSISPVDIDNIIIIDSTWQEAQKIYNQSPYLQAIPHITLSANTTSNYTLRRNQPSGGLCTAECIIEMYNIKNQHQHAAQLSIAFDDFNRLSSR